jgi:RHH-type rel operon transcriptional repressor/antitoxin RelB
MYFRNSCNTKNTAMPITVRLGESTEKRLEKLAKITGRTKTYYIKQALEEKLDELEDLYVAEQRIEQPSEKYWTLEELENGNDLAS